MFVAISQSLHRHKVANMVLDLPMFYANQEEALGRIARESKPADWWELL